MKKILSAALALMLVFTMSISAFAFDFGEAEYPQSIDHPDYDTLDAFISNSSKEYGDVFVVYDPYRATTNLYIVEDIAVPRVGNNGLWISASDGGRFFIATFQLVDGTWDYHSEVSRESNYNITLSSNVKWSANTVPSTDSTPPIVGQANFPRPPLAEQVQIVTDQAMLEEAMEVTKTMGLLTVSGIGLMALLIGLALFGKRSLISLR